MLENPVNACDANVGVALDLQARSIGGDRRLVGDGQVRGPGGNDGDGPADSAIWGLDDDEPRIIVVHCYLDGGSPGPGLLRLGPDPRAPTRSALGACGHTI